MKNINQSKHERRILRWVVSGSLSLQKKKKKKIIKSETFWKRKRSGFPAI